MTAHGLYALLLQEAQQGRLILQWQLPDLVEEQGAAIGRLNLAYLAALGTGEGALDVAEQLGLDQLMGHGAAVDGHKGTVFAEGAVVQLTSHQLLAGSAGPGHQHGQATMLQPHDLLAQLANGAALTLDEAQLSRHLGAMAPDELRHSQRMTQAVGKSFLIEREGVEIMETGCKQVAQGFTCQAITLDQANPQAAGVLANQGIQGVMLIRLDGHQHQGISLFLQFLFCHRQGTCLLHLPFAFYQQAFQHGT